MFSTAVLSSGHSSFSNISISTWKRRRDTEAITTSSHGCHQCCFVVDKPVCVCVCVSCSYIEQVFVGISLLQCVEDLDDPKASVLLAHQDGQGFCCQARGRRSKNMINIQN